MTQLVEGGCSIMLWLGLFDTNTCEAIVRDVLSIFDVPMWLKILVGPALAFIVITIVLLDDLCWRSKSKRILDSVQSISPVNTNTLTKRGFRKRFNRFTRTHQLTKFEAIIEKTDKIKDILNKESDEYLHIIVNDCNRGQHSCYKVHKHASLRHLVNAHIKLSSSITDMSFLESVDKFKHEEDTKIASQTVIRFNGRLLHLNKILIDCSFTDLDILDVEINFEKLYTDNLRQLSITQQKLNTSLQRGIEQENKTQEHIRLIESELKRVKHESATRQQNNIALQKNVAQIKIFKDSACSSEQSRIRLQKSLTLEKTAHKRDSAALERKNEQLAEAEKRILEAHKKIKKIESDMDALRVSTYQRISNAKQSTENTQHEECKRKLNILQRALDDRLQASKEVQVSMLDNDQTIHESTASVDSHDEAIHSVVSSLDTVISDRNDSLIVSTDISTSSSHSVNKVEDMNVSTITCKANTSISDITTTNSIPSSWCENQTHLLWPSMKNKHRRDSLLWPSTSSDTVANRISGASESSADISLSSSPPPPSSSSSSFIHTSTRLRPWRNCVMSVSANRTTPLLIIDDTMQQQKQMHDDDDDDDGTRVVERCSQQTFA